MRAIPALLSALVLFLAACGDGYSDDVDDSVSTTESEDTNDEADAEVDADGDDPASQDAGEENPGEQDPGEEDPGEGDGAEEDAARDESADHDDMAADGGGDTADGRIIEVALNDFSFDPAEISVAAGETVTFDLRNDGEAVHEFRLSNAHRIEEHIEAGHEDHGDEGGHHGDADVYLELESGESGRLTVTFPDDVTFFTEAACLLPGHYEAGMKAPLTYR